MHVYSPFLLQNNEISTDNVVILHINLKNIRGLKYIVVTLLIFFWIFYAMPAITLNIPYVQRKVTEATKEKLSEYLGVPIEIEHIKVKWLNHLVLEGLHMDDRVGEPLLEISHLSVGFKLLSFLQGDLVFTTARLFGFNIHLTKENSEKELNIQFLIDAFSSKDSTKKMPDLDFRFNSIMLRRGQVHYHVASEAITTDKFNAKHIDIENLTANISLKTVSKDSINAHIRKLSFNEASGFNLEKLSMNIVGNKDSTHIDNFEIKLPNSLITITKANLDSREVRGLSSLLDNAPIELNIAPSPICLKDLAVFVPSFKNITEQITLSAEASGYINNIDLRQLLIQQKDLLELHGRMELKGITDPQDTYLFGEINRLRITTEGLNNIYKVFNKNSNTSLPIQATQLGTLRFTGNISGFFDNMVAYGELISDIGTIKTDIIFGRDTKKHIATYVKGNVVSSNLAIYKLFQENNPYGDVQFSINIDASQPIGGSLAGNIQGEISEFDYKKYKYENIQLSGNFQRNSFDGIIKMDDLNGEIIAEGMFKNDGKNSIFNFTAGVNKLRLDQLNLTNKYEDPEISFLLNADFTGNSIDNVEGSIKIDSLLFKTLPSSFELNKMEIKASGYSEDRHLTIASDIINGEIIGAYSFNTIMPSFINTFDIFLPSLIKAKQKERTLKENNFSILLSIENTEDLSKTLKLPVTIIDKGKISGHYNNRYDKFRLEVWLPQFTIKKSIFESGHLLCENPNDRVDLQINAINHSRKGTENKINLNLNAKEDLISSSIHWKNNMENLFSADISASALFIEEKDEDNREQLRTEISIDKSPIYIRDSLWHIEPASITLQNGKIDVDNFIFAHDQQYLHLNGVISDNIQDTLQVDMQQIELSYIFDILNIPALQFAGEATGFVTINDIYVNRMMNAELTVDDFSFNKVPLGTLNLYSEWDDMQQGILMLGSIYKNDSTWTDVDGYIFPIKPKEGLSLRFNANDIDISFLQPFMQNAVKNFKGQGFGNIHLFGAFNELTVEGDAYVDKAGLGIEFLNTYYTFSDSVHLSPTQIKLENVTIKDKYGNEGKVDFAFNHKYFKNFDFDVNVQVNNMLLYDQSSRNNPAIYGTVFGSGTASIKGNENVIDFDINARNEENTTLGLNFMTNTASSEYSFITFVDKEDNNSNSTKIEPIKNDRKYQTRMNDGTELRMNFLVDITPEASVEMIMDPISGDKIKGKTSGSLQIQYGTKSDPRIYGGLNVVEGNYNFSLQQIIHRDFKIRDGSSINFQDDPMNATLNLNAIYNLTANISELNEGLSRESDRNNIPVNCVLLIDGMLQNPLISFDIELPGSNQEIERQVKSLIDSEDMMTRQIVYLLVLSKFYTPEYAINEYRVNDFSAVASSALSTQLTNMLNTLTDKVQIGTNIRASQDGGFDENTEVEMLLSSQLLDNRLIINGNFGYRNSMTMQRSVFVGEFDLEYKLTPSGDIRLKAYNHANDMYQYLKQSLTTQGVGIMFKKDFNRFSDLFRRKREKLISN